MGRKQLKVYFAKFCRPRAPVFSDRKSFVFTNAPVDWCFDILWEGFESVCWSGEGGGRGCLGCHIYISLLIEHVLMGRGGGGVINAHL